MGLIDIQRHKIITDFFDLVFKDRQSEKEIIERLQLKIAELEIENKRLKSNQCQC